jgi:hypothetical protein
MDKKNIIDGDFLAGWKNYVFDEEEILWKGKPSIEAYYKSLKTNLKFDFRDDHSPVIILLVFIVAILVFALYKIDQMTIAIIVAIVGLILPLVYEYLQHSFQFIDSHL